MVFFRSEERARRWCADRGQPLRPVVSMDQLWGLAKAWYATRLEPDSRRPTPPEMVRIFTGLGLSGDFWDATSDAYES